MQEIKIGDQVINCQPIWYHTFPTNGNEGEFIFIGFSDGQWVEGNNYGGSLVSITEREACRRLRDSQREFNWEPPLEIPDDPEDLSEETISKVSSVLDSLADAFGGHSQYGLDVIGLALAGQINNNSWCDSPSHLGKAAARLLAERWEEEDQESEDAGAKVIEAAIEVRLQEFV